MNSGLLERSAGALNGTAFARTQTSRLIHAFQAFPGLRFDGGEKEAAPDDQEELQVIARRTEPKLWAHQAGANALAIDIENKILVSGGADSSLKIWDLEKYVAGSTHVFKPKAILPRTSTAHKYGITHLSFYPFDSAAFLSSSYDHHLKLYSTETQEVSVDFDLNSIVYTHALSPIASHLLVACATQYPAVRLVDLRTGSNTHSLAGHHGALLSLAWNPRLEHCLASGGIDGTVRLWDIRKSSAALGVLDMEDPIGITGTNGMGQNARVRDKGKSHQGAVNGITWTGDGQFIISAGHDERVRVWDASNGANTLSSFGPTLKNSHLSNLPLLVSPTTLIPSGQDLLFFPNERELLIFELHRGRLLQRLKVPGPHIAAIRSRTGERNIKNRITGLILRGQADGVYSSHTDGQIRLWLPENVKDDAVEEEEGSKKRQADSDESEEGTRKRQVLETVFTGLTRDKIRFG